MASIQEYYDILGISEGATPKEIKKARAEKAREYANDKEKMILLTQAYEYFLNPERIVMPLDDEIDAIDEGTRAKLDELLRKFKESQTIEERNKYLFEARQIYERLLSENPNNEEILWNLATIENTLKNYEKSIAYLKQMVQKTSGKDRLDVYQKLGEVYQNLGKIDEAIKCYYAIYKEDASRTEDIKTLVRLSYENKQNIKIAIQILNDCITRCSETRLKIFYLCETLRAIRMLKNSSYQKVEETLYKKLEEFQTNDTETNNKNMEAVIIYMQDALKRRDFEAFHQLERIFESYHVQHARLNQILQGMKQVVIIMEKGKFHKVIDLYFLDVWTEKTWRELGDWIIRESAQIKESLECIKKEAPVYWQEWEEIFLDLEEVVNSHLSVSKEFQALQRDRTISFSLKKLVEYILLWDFVLYEDMKDEFLKERDAFFELEDKERAQHSLVKLEEFYPNCYKFFADVFFKDEKTKNVSNQNSSAANSMQQISQSIEKGIEETKKNSTLRKILHIVIGIFAFLLVGEALESSDALSELFALVFWGFVIYGGVKYYKSKKNSDKDETQRNMQWENIKKKGKKLLKIGAAILVFSFAISIVGGIFHSIKQNIEQKKEEKYIEDHNGALTDEELGYVDKLSEKYTKDTDVDIYYVQVDGDYEEEIDYPTEPDISYVWLGVRNYGYKSNIELRSNYLGYGEKEALWEEIEAVYDTDLTDYEKCEQYFELAHRYVKERQESMIEIPNLVGMSYDEAVHTLAQLGLYLYIENEVYSSEYEEGYITYQWNKPGDMTVEGSNICVDISIGDEYTAMHDKLLSTEELEKRDQLNAEYDAKINANIRFIQLQADEEIDYPSNEEIPCVWLIAREYEDEVELEIGISGLDDDNRELLTQEISSIYNSDATDFEKCKKFYAAAYNFVLYQELNQIEDGINDNDYMICEMDMNDIWGAMRYNLTVYEVAEDVKSTAVEDRDYGIEQYNKSASLYMNGKKNNIYGSLIYNEYYGVEQCNTFEWQINKKLTTNDIKNMFSVSLIGGGDNQGWANFSWQDKMYIYVDFASDRTSLFFSIYSQDADTANIRTGF